MSQTAPNQLNDQFKNSANQADDEIDLFALLMTLLNGWKIILACALIGLILGFTYSRYVQPTYQTDALLQIDEQSSGIAALGSNISELVGEPRSAAETERELIKSRMVLEPVVNMLNLDIQINDAEIGALDRIAQAGVPTQISTEKGVALDTTNGQVVIQKFDVPHAYKDETFNLVKTDLGFELSSIISDEEILFNGKMGSNVIFQTTEGDILINVQSLPTAEHVIEIRNLSTPSAIAALSDKLSVSEKGKQTGIVQLTLTGEDQKQVSRVLSSIVNSYVDQNLARGSEQTTTTIKFMESQIPELKQQLEESEEAFNNFREQYGTIDVSKESEILLNESAQIERQISELNLKQAELLTYYTNEHPLVVQINDQLQVLNARRQEIKNTVSGLPEVQREFLQLSQDMEINREIYLAMLKNYEQLKIARAGEIGYVRVVDMPLNTYEPIAPRKPIIWALSLILGTVLGSLLVLGRSLIRNTVKDPDRLESKTGVPVVATIPRSKTSFNIGSKKTSNRNLLTVLDHNSLSYEAIKSLRTSLIFSMPKQSKIAERYIQVNNKGSNFGKVISITGEAPGIGKSFISANLAETFSQIGKKVLIIDSDMRRGQLHDIFSQSPHDGLGDYLNTTNVQLNDFIHATNFDSIDFMPRGHHPKNPTSLLASDRFALMMQELVTVYDYIIIDTPPVLAVSDAIIVSQFADNVLMVVRYDHSIEGQVNYAVRTFAKADVKVDGIVLNDVVQGLTDRYSYHYSYAYGNSKD